MGVTNLRQELIKLAQKEKPENKIAKILAFYYPKLRLSDKKFFFEGLFYYYKISNEFDFSHIQEELNSENTVDVLANKDYRIKSFEVSNLRGIPSSEHGYPFGMNLTENGLIKNAIVLANNGTGKSSIFAGLEMIYAQEIGEKNLRVRNPKNLKIQDYSNYLRRFPENAKPHFKLQTQESEYSLDKIIFENKQLRQLLNPINHFISDFDIYDNGQIEFDSNPENDNSFHTLLANSLGLKEFIDFEFHLSELKIYNRLTEGLSLKKLTEQIQDLIKNVEAWEKSIDEEKALLLTLKQNEKNLPKVDIDKKIKEKINEKLNQNISYSIDPNDYTAALQKFQEEFIKYQSFEISEKKVIEKDFLNSGIELIHEFDNCPFCLNSHTSVDEIKHEVEIRLQKLNEQLKNEEEIRKAYQSFQSILTLFFYESTTIEYSLKKELNDITPFIQLISLAEKENEFIEALSFVLEEIELIESINELQKYKTPKLTEYKKLFDAIESRKNLFTDFFSQVLHKAEFFVKNRSEYLNRALEELNKALPESSIEKQIILLESEIEENQKRIVAAQKQIEQLRPQEENAKKDAALVTQIKNEIAEYIPSYKALVNNLVNEAFEPVKEMVETILTDYLQTDKYLALKIDQKENKVQIDGEEITTKIIVARLAHIDKDTGEIKYTTPDVYFNTFRYKLFSLMVSLSLALATRKKYKVNLPLVMDDLFYASDFISKHSFSIFINKVIKLFYKYSPELPLQFILFTHDDLIFKNAIDGLERFSFEKIDTKELCEENKKHPIERTIIGRFFDPKDKDDIPEKFEDEQLFWNLLYKLPNLVTL